MGLGIMRGCSTNCEQPAPNPSPDHWELINVHQAPRAYAVYVHYDHCTNYEGKKVMVFVGPYPGKMPDRLDPHFCEDDAISPIARFRPTMLGWTLAKQLADAF